MSDRPPLVSVIVPVYNVEKYLRECLDSVLGQTLRDIEIICVNDCTKDHSREILREYEAADSRLRVIDKPQNEGLAAARNTGLEAARGEFVLFVDSDDVVNKELCEKTYRKATAEGLDLVIFDYDQFREDGTHAPGGPFWSKKTFSPEMSHDEKLQSLACTFVSAWTKLSRRSLFLENGIRFPTKIAHGEDVLCHWQVICLSKKPGYLREVLYHWRVNPNSITHRKKKVWHSSVVTHETIKDFLQERGLYRGGFVGPFLYWRTADYDAMLSQQLSDKHDFAAAAAYVRKQTSFRELRFLFRAGIPVRHKIAIALFAVLVKLNLYRVYRKLRRTYLASAET